MTTNSDSAEAIVSQSLDIAAKFLVDHDRSLRNLDLNNIIPSVQDAIHSVERAAKLIRQALEANSRVTDIQKVDANSCFPYLHKAITQLLIEVHRADAPLFKEQLIAMYAPLVTQTANSISIPLQPKPPRSPVVLIS